MLSRTNDAIFAVCVQFTPTARLTECGLRRHATGRCLEELVHFRIIGARDVPFVECIAHGATVYGGQMAMDEAGAVQLTENGHNAPCPVHIFHMHVTLRRRDLGQARHLARKPVNIRHRKVDAALISCGKQVENGVCGTTHGDVEAHRIFESFKTRHIAGKDACILFLIITAAQFYREAPCFQEKRLAVSMGRQR